MWAYPRFVAGGGRRAAWIAEITLTLTDTGLIVSIVFIAYRIHSYTTSDCTIEALT
jgi:hypothetical protein